MKEQLEIIDKLIPQADLRPYAQEVMQRTIYDIDGTYSFDGDARNGAKAELYLPYHNGLHARKASHDAAAGAGIMQLSRLEYEITLVAMANHDAVQELDAGQGENEQNSAGKFIERVTRREGVFDRALVIAGSLGILGTECYFEPDGKMIQKAVMQDYPSKTADRIALVMASADMGRLYAADGPYMAHKLYQEIKTGGSGFNPSLDGLAEFQRKQINLLDGGYQYPLPELAGRFTRKQRAVIEHAVLLLKKLENGTVESWEEVMAADKVFYKSEA